MAKPRNPKYPPNSGYPSHNPDGTPHGKSGSDENAGIPGTGIKNRKSGGMPIKSGGSPVKSGGNPIKSGGSIKSGVDYSIIKRRKSGR